MTAHSPGSWTLHQWAKWSKTPKVATYPEFVLEDNTVLDYPVYVTENLSATHQALFLRASDCYIAIHGVDIVSDVMSLAYKGQVALTINVLASAGLLRGVACARTEDSAAQ
jgi:hypothetical protein